jgi:hypothetical protein
MAGLRRQGELGLDLPRAKGRQPVGHLLREIRSRRRVTSRSRELNHFASGCQRQEARDKNRQKQPHGMGTLPENATGHQ